MKLKLLIVSLAIFAVNITAQVYPEVQIKDIQFIPADSLIAYGQIGTEPPSSLEGDTVTVVGVVMTPPYEGANPDSIETLHSGAPSLYLQDTSQTEWSGILVRFPDATSIFNVLDSGTVIRATGVVGEFFTTTQFNLFDFQAQDIIGIQQRPEPVLLTLDSLVEMGSSNPKYTAEKWEHVYVELRNVTTSDPGVIGFNTFVISDNNNSAIVVGNNSDYWRRTNAPLPGTKIDVIRGYIETRTNIPNGWFMINPVFPEDIEYGDLLPPNVFNVERNKGVVGYGEGVTVSATIVDSDGGIDAVSLFYDVNGGAFQELDMFPLSAGDSVYSAAIPAQNDSSIISYYVQAVDNDGLVSTNPTNYQTNRYFYLVLNRDLTINDIQYSPFGTGFSAYDSYEVTVRGVVTADTTDIEGDGSNIGPQVYIQNGTGPWSGIQLFGTEALNLRRGDDVTVTGIVDEQFSVTRIENLDDPSNITVHGTAPVPAATVIGTDMISNTSSGQLPAESYEAVLVKYENVNVIDENADGDAGPNPASGNNYGEMLVADASNIQTRVELQDGAHDYHNFWDQALDGQPTRVLTGDSFDGITGILFFSFGNYKLVPRKNDDFEGFTTSVDESETLPLQYSLAQNYPNPFNPTTKIEYSLKEAGAVKISIFNVLGQKVQTLVNESKNAGVHHVSFNASSLPSGMYIYRIEAGSFISAKKMMLLK
jgi:hypothetical protein